MKEICRFPILVDFTEESRPKYIELDGKDGVGWKVDHFVREYGKTQYGGPGMYPYQPKINAIRKENIDPVLSEGALKSPERKSVYTRDDYSVQPKLVTYQITRNQEPDIQHGGPGYYPYDASKETTMNSRESLDDFAKRIGGSKNATWAINYAEKALIIGIPQ